MKTQTRKQLFYKNPFNHPSICFRKSEVLKVGGYDDINLYEDWFLWFKMSKLPNIVFHNFDKILLQYRIRSLDERRGWQVIKYETNFFKTLYKKKYINFFTLVINLFVRSLFRLMPKYIYIKTKLFFDNKTL